MNTHDHIRLLCLDCDGVLTDGTILLGDDGTEPAVRPPSLP